jgi:hypothetical protein
MSIPSTPLRNRFADTPTRLIVDERECWQWDLAELDRDPSAWSSPESSRAFIVAAIGDADAELARRDRLRSMPNAPSWPDPPPDWRPMLDEIKRRFPLCDFIEQYSPAVFTPSGSQLKCRCPFPDHEDRTPSFYVRPETDVFYCQGCHRGGDLFEFARHFLGIALFSDVAKLLGKWAGIDITNYSSQTTHIGGTNVMSSSVKKSTNKKSGFVPVEIRDGKVRPA